MHTANQVIPVALVNQPALMTKAEIAAELRRDLSTVDRLRSQDASFPKPLKEGTARQSRIYFVRAEFIAWLNRRLESRGEAA
ncbi:MAG TPA: transcriptional regulator [Pseudomonas sp.]|jgi:prophage regulatory protein|uniref:helix-turn-helix transcriptional regulator n=1 Tax=Pseudomonas sp. TaxID=306 RepID=UPI002ED79ABA